MASDAISARAEGVNEVVGGIVVLTRIHVRYDVRLPEGADPAKVDRALATHAAKCPTACSLKGSVEIGWQAAVMASDGSVREMAG